MTTLSEAEPSSASTLRRATLAAAIGNTVENYDYAVYGFVAAVLAKNFFPDATPGVALLSTFAVFGAAFVVTLAQGQAGFLKDGHWILLLVGVALHMAGHTAIRFMRSED